MILDRVSQSVNGNLETTVGEILQEIGSTVHPMTAAAGEPITIWLRGDLWLVEPRPGEAGRLVPAQAVPIGAEVAAGGPGGRTRGSRGAPGRAGGRSLEPLRVLHAASRGAAGWCRGRGWRQPVLVPSGSSSGRPAAPAYR
ncbi:hypothetical protein [Arenibaculum pallidiluteum]|uniref:hypothetical protein n=1 Tax=Arenibaculum pallidiluteum TaxID=2812559 RepID=UPI001A974186|nr:hypothetical protein [Arenibaculum pallidiluteum]